MSLHDIGIYSYIMQGSLAEFHGMKFSSYIMEGFLEIFHDMEVYAYIMEYYLVEFHGMEIYLYIMEIFFICCLRKNAPAVLLKYLKDRTALCYSLEQFYRQICHFLLLV